MLNKKVDWMGFELIPFYFYVKYDEPFQMKYYGYEWVLILYLWFIEITIAKPFLENKNNA